MLCGSRGVQMHSTTTLQVAQARRREARDLQARDRARRQDDRGPIAAVRDGLASFFHPMRPTGGSPA
jgi:hypothetical protein